MKKTILLLFTTIFILFGCEKNKIETNKIETNTIEKISIDIPNGLVHWDIIKVEGQTSTLVNDTIVLNVYCPTSSGCDYVSEFISDKYGNTIFIKAFGSTRKNTACSQGAMPIVVKYKFASNSKGEFELRFIKRDYSVIKYFLTIQ